VNNTGIRKGSIMK